MDDLAKLIELMNKLHSFKMNCVTSTFIEIFGERMGEHMAQTYVHNCKRDVIAFWSYMDTGNRALFVDYIIKQG